MNAKELKQKIQSNEPLVIIDIREPYECENGFISEINIPLSQFMDRIDEIPTDKLVVIYMGLLSNLENATIVCCNFDFYYNRQNL